MNKIEAIIFDFDGVIAASVNIKTEAFAELYRRYGKEIEEKVVKHHITNGGMSRFEKFKVYHEEFLKKTISEDEISELADKYSKLVVKKVIESPYVKGAKEFLQKFHKKYDFFISSGTPEVEIKHIAKMRGIGKYFKAIYGSPIKKEKHVEIILNENHLNNNEVVFIGDALSDREAATANSISFIGVLNENINFSKEKYKINDLSELELLLINCSAAL